MTLAEHVVVKRLSPGQDLKAALAELPATDGVESGVLLSVVGSLSAACLRLAGAADTTMLPGPLEIVSGTGTVGRCGIHVHVSLADSSGRTTGGHLLSGCLVHTTVELAILNLAGAWRFERPHDPRTGYHELLPSKLN